jgi:aryl-alcohol dehydrogenase-like predicted oxidoreductase
VLYRHRLAWDELALRFAAFTPGVWCCVVGTSRPENLKRCIELIERGPLRGEIVAEVRGAFQREGAGWPGRI